MYCQHLLSPHLSPANFGKGLAEAADSAMQCAGSLYYWASIKFCLSCRWVGNQGRYDVTRAATLVLCSPLRHGANICSIPRLPQSRRFAPRLHQHAAGTGCYVAPEGVGGGVQDNGQRGQSAQEVAAGQRDATHQDARGCLLLFELGYVLRGKVVKHCSKLLCTQQL